MCPNRKGQGGDKVESRLVWFGLLGWMREVLGGQIEIRGIGDR